MSTRPAAFLVLASLFLYIQDAIIRFEKTEKNGGKKFKIPPDNPVISRVGILPQEIPGSGPAVAVDRFFHPGFSGILLRICGLSPSVYAPDAQFMLEDPAYAIARNRTDR